MLEDSLGTLEEILGKCNNKCPGCFITGCHVEQLRQCCRLPVGLAVHATLTTSRVPNDVLQQTTHIPLPYTLPETKTYPDQLPQPHFLFGWKSCMGMSTKACNISGVRGRWFGGCAGSSNTICLTASVIGISTKHAYHLNLLQHPNASIQGWGSICLLNLSHWNDTKIHSKKCLLHLHIW